MKMTKQIFAAFVFFDRTGIQAFLEKQAEKGWMFEKFGILGWKFRRIQPKKLHFAVTYFPKASQFDPEPPEDQLRFQEFCAHAGWQFVDANAQMQVFYHEAESPGPIETDPAMELENIHRSAKKSYLPLFYLVLFCALVKGAVFRMDLYNSLVQTLANCGYLYGLVAWCCLGLIALVRIIGYFRWCAKAKQAAANGQFLDTRSKHGFENVLFAAIFLCFAATLLSWDDPKLTILCIWMLIVYGVIRLAMTGLQIGLKKLKVDALDSKYLLAVASVVICLAMMMGLWAVIEDMEKLPGEDGDAGTYRYDGIPFEIRDDELPISVEDLLDVEPDVYSHEKMDSMETLLVGWYRAIERPMNGDMYYTIVDVKAGFLYGACLEDMLSPEYGYSGVYGEADPAPWGAERAYRFQKNAEHGQEETHYLLCYPGRIILFDARWEMTPEQMAAVGQILGG